jgi:hypothetical protein
VRCAGTGAALSLVPRASVAIVVHGGGALCRRSRHVPAGYAGLLFATEAVLEAVATSVGEEGRHTSGGESGRRRVVLGVVAVEVGGIGVNRLALGLAPGDAPSGMAARGGDGDDVADVFGRRAQRPLEYGHAAHGTANDDGDLPDAKMVEDQLVEPVAPAEGSSLCSRACRRTSHRPGRSSEGTRVRSASPTLGCG